MYLNRNLFLLSNIINTVVVYFIYIYILHVLCTFLQLQTSHKCVKIQSDNCYERSTDGKKLL